MPDSQRQEERAVVGLELTELKSGSAGVAVACVALPATGGVAVGSGAAMGVGVCAAPAGNGVVTAALPPIN